MYEAYVKVKCDDCEEYLDIDSFELNTMCNDCIRHREDESYKNILIELFDDVSILDGSNLVGYNSEREKEMFLLGARYGYSQAAWMFSEYTNQTDLWEDWHEKFCKLKINISYDTEREKKHREECNNDR
jgi:hypothetical protein